MGGGKKSKAPAAPDYASLANTDAAAQYKMAQDVTGWNRPTQNDAWGNQISWTQDANGNWTQNQTLSNDMKWAQGDAMQAYRNAAWAAGQQGAFAPTDNVDWVQNMLNETNYHGNFVNNAGDVGYFNNTAGAIGDFDRTQGDQVAKDMYESSMSRLRPEQQRTQEALDVKLRQQGLQPGTEAYNRAMQNEMTSQGDVNSKLALDSTGAGYNAAMGIYNTNLAGQGQRYGQLQGDYAANLAGQGQRFDQAQKEYETNIQTDLAKTEAARALQQQRYNQDIQNYTMPMERAQAAAQLYAQSPRPEFAGFGTATGYNPANMSNAAQAGYQAKMGQSNAQSNKKGGLMNAGASLGSAFLGSK